MNSVDGNEFFTDAVLKVPKGLAAKYKETEGWRLFWWSTTLKPAMALTRMKASF